MTNSNCLEGIRCPKCGQEDRFMIAAKIIADVTDGGADVASPKYGNGFEWDEASYCRCPECDFEGKLKDFHEKPELPPDPEGMNDDRSAWAGAALATFMQVTGSEKEDALGDLLTNLMHYSDRNNFDFDAALDRARWHYEAETGRESPG
jgi:hypothetical protein